MFSSAPPPAPPAATPAEAKAAPPGPPPVVHINTDLEKCAQSLGTVTVNEDIGSIWYSQLRGYKLPSTSTVLHLLVQQSGCFVWGDRSGAQKSKSNKNTAPQSADYTLSPALSFTDATTKGAPPNVTTTLTLQDNRSNVQLAQTEGEAHYVDFSIYQAMFNAPNAGTGAYVKSPEGRAVAASFVDAYNLLVRAARSYQPPGLTMPSVPKVSMPTTMPSTPSVPSTPKAPSLQTPRLP